MAKGKFEYWLSEEGLLRIAAWARDGLTDDQTSKNMGICRDTLNEWRKRFPAISDALKKGKEIVDIEVENALHRRAMGYTVPLKKTFKVRRVEFDEESGRKIAEIEELREGIDELHVPADVTAQIFWLRNRKPEAWRNNPEARASEADGMLPLVLEAVSRLE